MKAKRCVDTYRALFVCNSRYQNNKVGVLGPDCDAPTRSVRIREEGGGRREVRGRGRGTIGEEVGHTKMYFFFGLNEPMSSTTFNDKDSDWHCCLNLAGLRLIPLLLLLLSLVHSLLTM